MPRPQPLTALCSPASSNLGHASEAERSTALPTWARYARGLGMLNRRGPGTLRFDGAHRLRESRRRAGLRRQLRVQGPASGPHRLIGQSTRTRAALTWHPKECIASRGLVRHRRRGLGGACGGGGSHRLGCLPTGLGCLQAEGSASLRPLRVDRPLGEKCSHPTSRVAALPTPNNPCKSSPGPTMKRLVSR